MDIFVIFLEIYSGESATVIFSIIITNIDRELLSCLAHKFGLILLMNDVFYANNLITKD